MVVEVEPADRPVELGIPPGPQVPHSILLLIIRRYKQYSPGGEC